MIYRARIYTFPLFTLAALLAIPAFAFAEATEQTIKPTSSVAMSIGTDSLQNRSRQFQLNIEFSTYHQISAGYGDLRSTASSLNTNQYYFGVATSPYEKYSAGIEYSKWGKNKKLEIESLQTDLYANYANWSIGLSPQINRVWLYANNGNSYGVSSKGISISANYYGVDPYFFGFNVLENKITNNTRFLETPALREIALRRLSVSAQLLISGLEKDHQGVSIGRYFQWGSLELEWTKSNAALVDFQTDTRSFILDYQLTTNFSLNLIASQQISNASSKPLQAIDLGISAYW